jgi:hypothetical protein
MSKKEFLTGLYPNAEVREDRIEKLKSELDILISNKESLEKQINILTFELSIINDMEKLENVIDGKYTIIPKNNREDE